MATAREPTKDPQPKPTRKRPPMRLGHAINLAGRRSGTLIAERYVQTHRQGSDEALQMAMWECRCTKCGNIVRRARRYIVSGKARCTCQRKIRSDLTGKRFGRWKVQGPAARVGGQSWWVLVCDCGEVRELPRNYFVSGDSRSCGCLRKETTKANQARQARARRAARTRQRRSAR